MRQISERIYGFWYQRTVCPSPYRRHKLPAVAQAPSGGTDLMCALRCVRVRIRWETPSVRILNRSMKLRSNQRRRDATAMTTTTATMPNGGGNKAAYTAGFTDARRCAQTVNGLPTGSTLAVNFAAMPAHLHTHYIQHHTHTAHRIATTYAYMYT